MAFRKNEKQRKNGEFTRFLLRENEGYTSTQGNITFVDVREASLGLCRALDEENAEPRRLSSDVGIYGQNADIDA